MPPARVLIADDDATIRHLLQTALRRSGFQVIEARNGKEALIEMGAGRADLVLLDLMMPEVSGWEVLRHRAADPSLQRIPIIVISAIDEAEVNADLMKAQANAVIAKPFDLNKLTATITALLEPATTGAPAAA